MNYLPVLSYGTGKRLLQRHHCCPAIDSGVACADKGNTSPLDSVVSEPKVHPGQNVQTTGSNPRPAKPPSGPRKPSTQQKKPSKPAKPVHAAEARTKAVYHAMECLLEQGAFSDADLLRAVTNLSGDEFLQVTAAVCSYILAVLFLPHAILHLRLLCCAQQQVSACKLGTM